jgi:hypothetical protein
MRRLLTALLVLPCLSMPAYAIDIGAMPNTR